MLPGASGLRWMPRKIAGIAMITIDPSIVAISIVSVVFDSAIHLYRSDTWPDRCGGPGGATGGGPAGCRLDIPPTGIEFTVRRLLAGNHLPGWLGGRRQVYLQLDAIPTAANHNESPVCHFSGDCALCSPP